ncbi:hypothetical protein WISP_47883 [Willisornis vidua]|uniref:Uncharacterized protein n=1 Tax=Willisornis vidua TaxID=1566151 RepID=A0ABQ9DES4_9PASS|nr:hypothetical protein WISP_47883 [Willisornis vidua]
MEDPTPEQLDVPKKAVALWEAQAGAGSWQDLLRSSSPCCSRFAGRTCDPMEDPQWSSLGRTEACGKDWHGRSSWMTVFSGRDTVLEQGKSVRRAPLEEEGVAEKMCDEPAATPIPCLPVLMEGGR